LVGKTYRSTEKTPLGISEVSLAELRKEEFLEDHEKPSLLNPKRGYIYTANNRHWPSDAKFYGGRGYSYSYRGFRIDELLKGTHDFKTFQNIQCDNQVVDARFFLPKIQKILNLAQFKKWSMTADDSSEVLPLYRRLLDIIMERWDINEYALFKMLDGLTPAQEKEIHEFYQLAQKEIGGRNWGQIHRLHFPHMSKDESFHFAPNLAGVGDTHSVNPGTAKWNADKKIYEQYSGASMRMIIEMDEPPKIWLALPGLNRLYDQQASFSPWEEWKNCSYREVKF
jgi:acyl-homoserine lactone acylase PvdQ